MGWSLLSCEYLRFKKEAAAERDGLQTEKPIARVYDKYLYASDLSGLISKNMGLADSQNIVERYVKSWIKKQLLIQEATAKLQIPEAELERKVLDYRYALMAYEFEKFYVNNELDKEISEEDIAAYYNQNQQNFELKQNIIRGLFIKVPKEAPKMARLKKWLEAPDKNKEELRSYCYRFASVHFLEDSIWLNFDDVIKNTPFAGIPNKVQFLQQNREVEQEDQSYFYYLKINEYKISDQQSPLEFVRDDIATLLLNKRKVELTQRLQDKLYERASKRNDIEIYAPQN
ncbi:MAG: peptidyl-prolyl cis-trans isomerase [Cytophagales bacterium]|nr:peptidyl-prolyl cis-trans isomerase [Cytophagales bacterium]